MQSIHSTSKFEIYIQHVVLHDENHVDNLVKIIRYMYEHLFIYLFYYSFTIFKPSIVRYYSSLTYYLDLYS